MARKIPDDMKPGTIYDSSKSGKFKIINYLDSKNIIIEFINTGFVRSSSSVQIRKGVVMDTSSLRGSTTPSVCGVGMNDLTYSAKSKEYVYWTGMLRRCYDPKIKDREKYATYKDCIVCDEWLSLKNFGEWVSSQKGFGLEDYQLDKDLLIKGNKIYSPETCCLVPREINMALTLRENDRGQYPLGVTRGKLRKKSNSYDFTVKVLRGNLKPITKVFKTVEEAANFYKINKLEHLSYLADKYKDTIEEKVYLKLKNYEL